MVTYVGILEKAGTIDMISEHAAEVGAPIAVPLLLSSHLSAAGLVAALAISTTIVDVSPFSTNGALVLSNARGVDRQRFYRQIIGYTCGIVAFGPVLAWGALVLPGVL